MPNIEAVVTATEKLLSPAAPRVLALAGSREPKLEELREAVSLDPMLTVRVINHANHSFYARQVPVVSVRRALVRLGWSASQGLLARLLIEGAAHRLPDGTGAPVWERATRVATLSRAIARASGAVSTELAYTAGLTHSLGVLGLLSLHQASYARTVAQAPSGVHLAALEREAYGYDHARIGAGLLDRLTVPQPLVDAVLWQYNARVATKDWHGNHSLALAGTLQLCHRLLAKGRGGLPALDVMAAEPLWRPLAVERDAIETVRERFLDEVEQQSAAA